MLEEAVQAQGNHFLLAKYGRRKWKRRNKRERGRKEEMVEKREEEKMIEKRERRENLVEIR